VLSKHNKSLLQADAEMGMMNITVMLDRTMRRYKNVLEK
jgi:hypothetical protein